MDSNICIICQKSEDFPLFYGDFFKKKSSSVHYFCLLFSNNLAQTGKDNVGFLGFRICDVKRYALNIRDKKCIYCNETSASLKCFECKSDFHLICGVQAKCHFQFIGEFKCFCHLHIQVKHDIIHSDIQSCGICLTKMGPYHPILSVGPKCCVGEWFHRSCIMKYCLSAGYYVKCLYCQSNEFRNQIRLEGIFVPDRDACWETESNAYIDLHCPKRKCNATDCLCPKGREFINGKTAIWSITLCMMCGAFPIHNGCLQSSSTMNNDEFICNACILIRTIRSLGIETFHENNTLISCSNTSEPNEKISDLDKTLYLIKTQPSIEFFYNENIIHTTDENMHNEKEVDLNVRNIESVSIYDILELNQEITENKIQEEMESSDKLMEFYFKNQSFKGTITGYLKNPNEIKIQYSQDDIIPKMIELKSTLNSSSDLEVDDEDRELFSSILKDELKKDLNQNKLNQVRKRKNLEDKNKIKTYFLKSKEYKNLNCILSAENSTNEEKLNKENCDISKIKIKKIIVSECEFNGSDSKISLSNQKTFERVLKSEIENENLINF